MADLAVVRAALQFSEMRTDKFRLSDFHNKLAILAVWKRLKPAFAYGLGEDALDVEIVEGLISAADDLGLYHRLTDQPEMSSSIRTCGVPDWFTSEFAKLVEEVQSPGVLWILPDEHSADTAERIAGSREAGLFLGFPNCCAEDDDQNHRAKVRNLYAAFVNGCGESPKRILAALRGSKAWPGYDNPGIRAASRTFLRYPYVFHVACDACLTGSDTPSARLNERYRQFAQDCGAEFYDGLLEAIREAQDWAKEDLGAQR